MIITNTKIIKESSSTLQKCNKLVDSIATTCCLPERSSNMVELQIIIADMISTIEKIKTNPDNIKKCIESAGVLGSKIGYLNVTCCTSTRESKYQMLFTELMLVHRNMWALLGHG